MHGRCSAQMVQHERLNTSPELLQSPVRRFDSARCLLDFRRSGAVSDLTVAYRGRRAFAGVSRDPRWKTRDFRGTRHSRVTPSRSKARFEGVDCACVLFVHHLCPRTGQTRTESGHSRGVATGEGRRLGAVSALEVVVVDERPAAAWLGEEARGAVTRTGRHPAHGRT